MMKEIDDGGFQEPLKRSEFSPDMKNEIEYKMNAILQYIERVYGVKYTAKQLNTFLMIMAIDEIAGPQLKTVIASAENAYKESQIIDDTLKKLIDSPEEQE